MFWLRNKKINFLMHTLILGPGEFLEITYQLYKISAFYSNDERPGEYFHELPRDEEDVVAVRLSPRNLRDLPIYLIDSTR